MYIRIILFGVWIRFMCVRIETAGGNEPSGLVKGGEFLDKLSHYKLLKKHSATWS
jgi:hypothetical protein